MTFFRFALVLSSLLAAPALALDALPYPKGSLNADQIVAQVYTAAHGGLVRNAVSRRNKRSVALVINRAPRDMRQPGRRPTVQTFETFVNNAPQDPAFTSLQMAILTSGKARGTGVLLTNYSDADRKSTISMWLPALRKIRRINEPAHDDVWFGTNLTYGELVLRRPGDETHELLEQSEFPDCLAVMQLERWEQDRYTRKLPEAQCGHKGRPVYRIKSTTKFPNWWYDYHVSDVDRETFAIYRTVYFKGEEKVKTVDVDWQSLDHPDPRVIYPRYIFAVSHGDGKESMVFVPRDTIALDQEMADDFWSETTLMNYRP
jgi:hypothetical protein